MAKQRGPVASTFSGRVGNIVGAKLKGGEYVTRSYQPSVKNPNTLRQRVSRLRMATASQVAAGLALAIQAGYGKSAGSTKMYPRNMFVRGLVKLNSDSPLHVTNEVASVTYSDLQVSQRNGISSLPAVGSVDFNEPSKVSVSVTAQAVADVLPAGKMGIVVVVYAPEIGMSAVKGFDAPTTGTTSLAVTVPSLMSGEEVHVYVFNKWIPETGNDIATDTEPWKYPSETSATVYAGTGTIA